MDFQRAAASRMGFAYEMLPRIEKAGRTSRKLNILLADVTIDADRINRLASVELLQLYFDEIRSDVDLRIEVLVPRSFAEVVRIFQSLGTRYRIVDDFNFADSDALHAAARALDCGVVLVKDQDVVRQRNTDDYMMVTEHIDVVLRECELLSKGFDAPWSFEYPTKDAPWGQFYIISERSLFASLQEDFLTAKQASEAVYETMRLLMHTLQVICYCRDRMAFYRQQDRWAMRAGIERQSFEFEYSTYLNLFYLGLYSAVDQVAGLVVRRLALEVRPENIGATYAKFREALRPHPGVLTIFDGEDFWDWYGRVKSIRHDAAHNGLRNPLTVYTDDSEFSDEEIERAATESGLLDEVARLPDFMQAYGREMALFRASLILRGAPLRHVLLVQNAGKSYLYNPDPHSELDRFVSFFKRVLEQLKPWREDVARA